MGRRYAIGLLMVLIALCYAETGCGAGGLGGTSVGSGPPPLSPGPEFSYSTLAQGYSALRIDPISGTLSPVPGSPFLSTGDGVGVPFLLAIAKGRFLYAAEKVSDDISGYMIDASSGALSSINPPPLLYFDNGIPFFTSAAVDPQGKLLYFSVDAGGVWVYGVDGTTGNLTPLQTGTTFNNQTENALASLAVAPSGNFLYTISIIDGYIRGYSINRATGSLTPVAGSPFAAGPSPWPDFPLIKEAARNYIAIDPQGKLLYAANEGPGGNSVSGFTIDPNTGSLAPIPGSPFAAGERPVSTVIDPSGRFVYVANSQSGDVSAYQIGDGGSLTPVAGSPYPVGNCTAQVTTEPSGKFLYVVSELVHGYSIDSNTGKLSELAGSPFPASILPGDCYYAGVLVTTQTAP